MWKNLRLYIYMNIYLFRGKEVGGGDWPLVVVVVAAVVIENIKLGPSPPKLGKAEIKNMTQNKF